jgi:TRAP-type C4-dicarboxylate transport system permease small subunit
MGTQVSAAPLKETFGTLRKLDRYVTRLNEFLYWIAGAGLIAMLVLVVADIVGIKALSHPVPGGIEVVAFLGVVVIGFAIGYVVILRGHIQVDIIIMKLSPRPRAVVEVFTTFLGIALFSILAWRTWDYAYTIQLSGQVSMTQRIPFYPFIYALAFCYLATFLLLVMKFIKAVLKAGQRWTP